MKSLPLIYGHYWMAVRARSEFVHLISEFETNPENIVGKILSADDDVTRKRALILSLGGFPLNGVPIALRGQLAAALVERFRSSSDSGIHSAIDWVVRHEWGLGERLSQIEEELAPIDREATSSGCALPRQWYVRGRKQTMVVVNGPVSFWMGSPDSEPGRRPKGESRHRRRIDRTFAISSQEVTREQYGLFLDQNKDIERPDRPEAFEEMGAFMPEPECPVVGVNWYEAARFCNWSSLQEGIPESEWCFPPDIDPTRPLSLSPGYLSRTGYRLPTEAEWEFACRAGADTTRPFGDSEARMRSYAWFMDNSGLRTRPVGSKKPNDLGLFDILGNATEWTLTIRDSSGDYPISESGEIVLDDEVHNPISARDDCMLRGGSFYYPALNLRSANRNWNSPSLRENTIGFRLAA